MKEATMPAARAAKVLGVTKKNLCLLMWNHGFDPVHIGEKGEHFYRKKDLRQMRDERIRWGMMEKQIEWDAAEWLRSDGSLERGEYRPPADFDTEKHRLERKKISAQLDASPVLAADIDYIASRAGERRSRGVAGQTVFIAGGVR